MRYSNLGRTGLRVSKLALGTATFGVAPREQDAERLVHTALDLGINLFDCANSYGNQKRFDRPGVPSADERASAEEILGRSLGARRDEIVLCTKVCEPVGVGVNDRGLSRRHIFAQVDQSLKRLGTDYIDVYHAHRPDPNTPIEETLRTFDDLIRMGKIRHYALSTYPAYQMVEALWHADRHGMSTPACHQLPYNLGFRNVESELIPVCERYGVSITVFTPLGGGIFAGGDVLSRSFSGHARWGGPGFSESQVKLGQQLQKIADEYGHPAPHLAIAWLLTRPAIATAIIGPESIAELSANIGAADIDLDKEIITALDDVGKDGDHSKVP